jgi:putative endonuclease
MQKNSQNYGAWGEEEAVAYLKRNGYSILERNWRYKHLEIDIIAKKGETLVIVEVKSRKNDTFGEPEIFVNKRKQQFLITAANSYVLERDLDYEVRFDIVALTGSEVKHIEDAFYPLA